MLASLKHRESKILFVVYSTLFIIGVITMLPIFSGDENKELELTHARFTYFILSSCFAGAAFIVIMDYTFTLFKDPLFQFRKSSGWFFSLAMLIWALRGLSYFFFQNHFKDIPPMLSTLNSLFLILGAARLDLAPEEKPKFLGWEIMDWRIYKEKNYLFVITGLAIVAQLVIAIYFWGDDNFSDYVARPDLVYSTITVFYIWNVFEAAFKARGMPAFTILIRASLLFTYVVQIIRSFKWLEAILNFNSISYYYVGSLEIIIFGLLLSYYGKKSLEQERENTQNLQKRFNEYQRLRSDMNHNIRNALSDLHLDLSSHLKEKGTFNLNDIIFRIMNLQSLHDHLHGTKQKDVNLEEYLVLITQSFRDSYALEAHQLQTEFALPMTINPTIEIARKVGGTLVELNINAYQAMKSASMPIKILNKIYAMDNHLVIEVVDEGPGYKEDATPGFGTQNIRDNLSFIGGDSSLTYCPQPHGKGTVAQVKFSLPHLLN